MIIQICMKLVSCKNFNITVYPSHIVHTRYTKRNGYQWLFNRFECIDLIQNKARTLATVDNFSPTELESTSFSKRL